MKLKIIDKQFSGYSIICPAKGHYPRHVLDILFHMSRLEILNEISIGDSSEIYFLCKFIPKSNVMGNLIEEIQKLILNTQIKTIITPRDIDEIKNWYSTMRTIPFDIIIPRHVVGKFASSYFDFDKIQSASIDPRINSCIYIKSRLTEFYNEIDDLKILDVRIPYFTDEEVFICKVNLKANGSSTTVKLLQNFIVNLQYTFKYYRNTKWESLVDNYCKANNAGDIVAIPAYVAEIETYFTLNSSIDSSNKINNSQNLKDENSKNSPNGRIIEIPGPETKTLVTVLSGKAIG
jgi:hypothetical protein